MQFGSAWRCYARSKGNGFAVTILRPGANHFDAPVYKVPLVAHDQTKQPLQTVEATFRAAPESRCMTKNKWGICGCQQRTIKDRNTVRTFHGLEVLK